MTDAMDLVVSLGLTAADVEGPLPSTGPRTPATWGTPETWTRTLYEQGPVSCGVWECTPGGWTIEDRPNTEIIHIVHGRATLTDADGTAHALGAGSVHVLPKGWSGTWDITETVRKVWVVIDGS